MNELYLDWNATAPPSPAVCEAVAVAMRQAWANPSSAHAIGRASGAALAVARDQVGALFGRDGRDVTFTSGASEANAWALGQAPTTERPEVWVSAVEHPSVIAWATGRLPVDSNGVLRLDALDALLAERADRIAVVSVMAANNETGVLQPIGEIARRCRSAGVRFHCDATQIPNRLSASEIGACADLITLTAHKAAGPRGIGALLATDPPPPLVRGGSQELGRRAGTPAVPLAVGFGVAAAGARVHDPAERDRLEQACERLGGRVVSKGAPRLPNTATVMFPWPGDLIVMALDLEGIAASSGSACHSGAVTHSDVLDAMGETGIPVRFSLGPDTRVDAAIPVLERVVARLEATLPRGNPGEARSA